MASKRTVAFVAELNRRLDARTVNEGPRSKKPTMRKAYDPWLSMLNKQYQPSIRHRVSRAARMLDMTSSHPWFRKIDLGKLNLADPEQCILGQIFGNWHDAFVVAYPEQRRWPAFLCRSRAAHKAWREEIRKRLGAK